MAVLAQGSQGSVPVHHGQHMSLYAIQRCPMALQLLYRPRSFGRAQSRRMLSTPIQAAPTGFVVNVKPSFDGAAGQPDGQVQSVVEAPVSPPLQVAEPPTEAVDSLEHSAQSPVVAEAPDRDLVAKAERKKLWSAAIKLPMYSVGIIPVLVAAANVFLAHGVLPWDRMAGFAAAAFLVIAWLNLSNDAFDAQTGVDTTKPESVVNLLGGGPSRRAGVLVLAKALLLAGAALLAQLITSAPGNDLRPAGLLAFSIACGYVYQGPPFRMSYKGLGEPLCFFAFGPSATTAFYLAMQPNGAAAALGATAGVAASTAASAAATAITNAATAVAAAATAAVSAASVTTVAASASASAPTVAAAVAAAAASSADAAVAAAAALAAGVPLAVWSCSLLVGLTTTVILFCSHFHQIAGDTAAGKQSPLVRLGTERARGVLRAAAVGTQGAALLAAAAGALPWAAAAAVSLAAPAAREMVAFADDNHTVPARVAPLKRFAVKWHIVLGMCLCLGLAGARVVLAGV